MAAALEQVVDLVGRCIACDGVRAGGRHRPQGPVRVAVQGAGGGDLVGDQGGDAGREEVLSASASRAGRAWTDEGTARQERGLKHRADNETRTIPIPPVLVRVLRTHIKRFGTTPDGRIFQTARGGILQDSGYNEVWDQARKAALTPAQYRSPLGRRPYDLRHAAVSLWLNSGVPATEVARRAGHGVAVLLKIYAHCIDG
jgi:hypothetical protein